MTLAPSALSAIATLVAIDRRDREERAEALAKIEASSAAWERKHGRCASCGDGCPGVRVLGLHCPDCRLPLRPEWCELDSVGQRNPKDIVRVTCPCGESSTLEMD